MKKKRGLILLLAALATACCVGAMSSCDGCEGCTPQVVTDYVEEHKPPAEYTLTIHKNIPEAGTVTGMGTYEEGDTARVLVNTNEGYKFVGWFNTNGENVSLDTGVVFYSFTIHANTVLTAVWEPIQSSGPSDPGTPTDTYTIQATKNIAAAGEVAGGGQYEAGATVNLVAVTNVGYKFNGWYDGSTQVSENATYSFIATESKTYQAKWGIKRLDVTFDTDGGSNVDTQSIQEGKFATKPADPTKEGHTFVGWYNGTEEWSFTEDAIMQETTLKAHWTANDYTLTLTKNIDGAGTVSGEGTYTYGKKVTVKAVSNAGFTWDGWYMGSNRVSTDMEYEYTMGLDTTLMAKWAGGMTPDAEPDTGEEDETLIGSVAPAEPIYVIGKTGDLNVTMTGVDGYTHVSVDKLTIENTNYTWADGLFTLKQAFMETLTLGDHIVRVHTAEGVCRFKVCVYKLAKPVDGTIGDTNEQNGDVYYNQDNKSNATFAIDFGGATFVGISIGGDSVPQSQYTLTDNTIEIDYAFIEESCADGANQMVIETMAGKSVSTFYCTTERIVATFEKTTYKIQQATGEDVAFTFDAKTASYTLSLVSDAAVTAADDAVYVYDATNTTLTIKGSYLDTLEAGIYEFLLEVSDEESTTVKFWVAAYGQEGKTIAYPTTTNPMNNFDSMTNGWACGQNMVTDEMFTGGASSMVVEEADGAISGKSLKVSSLYGTEVGWNTLLGYNLDFVETQRYLVKFKMRITFATDATNGQIAVRFFKNISETEEAVVNGLFVNVDANGANGLADASDAMTNYTYDSITGVYDVNAYMTPNASGQMLNITAINLGYCVVMIDDIMILAVDSSSSAGLPDYDFEDKATGAGLNDFGLTTVGATGVVVEEGAINGNKSLQLTSTTDGAAAEWNIMLRSNCALTAGERYLLTAKVKWTLPTTISSGTIAFRLVGTGEVNGLFMNVSADTASAGTTSDTQTSMVYDSATGVATVKVYMTPTNADQKLNITTVGLGAWTLLIDDIKMERIVETGIKYTFEDATTGDYMSQMTNAFYTGGSTATVIETGAISGTKSLQVTTATSAENAGWNVLMQSDTAVVVGTRYLTQLKFKYTMPTTISSGTIAIRLVGSSEVNGMFFDVAGGAPSQGTTSDTESSFSYDAATGVITANVYMTATSSDQKLNITTVGGGVWTIVMDDFYFGTDVGFDITTGGDVGGETGGTGEGGGTSSSLVAFDFENASEGAWNALDKLNNGLGADASVVTTGAINGTKSLQLTTNATGEGAGWNIMMHSAFGSTAGTRYAISMKLKPVTVPSGTDKQIYVRLVGATDSMQVNGLVVNMVDASVASTTDSQTTFSYDFSTGIATATVYMTATENNQNFYLTTVGGGAWTLLVDDFVIEEAEAVSYTVTATSEDTTKGTVTGGSTYVGGASATLTATPATGYVFDGWYEGDARVSTSATYTFTVTADKTLMAKFIAESSVTTYTVTATSANTAQGTVTGGGAYAEGASVTLQATPATGYVFDGWYNESDALVDSAPSYTFTANNNVTLTAKFKVAPVTALTSNDFESANLGSYSVLDATTGCTSMLYPTENGATGQVVGAISGTKSLQLTTTEAGKTSFFNTVVKSEINATAGTTYVVSLKMKMTAPTSGIEVWLRLYGATDSLQVNGYKLNANGTEKESGNTANTYAYDSATGVITLQMNVTATENGQWFEIATATDQSNGGGAWTITIDDFAVTNASTSAAVTSNDFESAGLGSYSVLDATTGCTSMLYPTENGATGQVVGAISGTKSLQLTTTEAGKTSFFNTVVKSEINATAGTTYVVSLKMKMTAPTSGIEVWLRLYGATDSLQVNGYKLNANGTEKESGNTANTYAYDSATGVITLQMNVTATENGQWFEIATATDQSNGGGVWTITIDDFMVANA